MAKDSANAATFSWQRDLRGWLDCLESAGDLKTVSAKVTPDGEIQEIGRRMSACGGPAVLFTNIENHEESWCSKLLIGSLNTFGKAALAVGLPPHTPLPVVVAKMQETLKTPVPPAIVDNGPVKQNIITTGIDINELPVPWWHPKDGGRYINVWHGVVTKDPDTGEHNIGCYRGQIVDRETIVSLLVRSQGWGQHYEKYREKGEDMPVAFIYGVDPAIMITASAPMATSGVWGEYEWAGALAGEAIPVVKCETVDLYVPANAEIVLEGRVLSDPATFAEEGPFKEASGVYATPDMRPVMKVSCITHRDDPVFTGTATGIAPVVEEQFIPAVASTAAIMKNHLVNSGVPFTDLTLAPFFAVKIKKMWQGHPLQVAYSLFGHKSSNFPFKMLVVVEEDVNIYDPREIIRAINNNVDPARDTHVLPAHNLIFDGAMSETNGNIEEYGACLGNKLFIDATVDWKRHPRQEKLGGARVAPPEPPITEDVEKVKGRWAEYGFGDIEHTP
jgi:UbiD family decarboxylase